MSGEDSRYKALESLLRPVTGGRQEIVVTYRKHEDYENYEHRIAELTAKVEHQQAEIYKWTMMGTQYLDALDELRRLKLILKHHNIDF